MGRFRESWALALASALTWATFGLPAAAQAVDEASRSAARDLGYEGIELLQKGDAARATERLERAFQVLKVPTIGLWSARALVAAGKLVEGSERYVEVQRLPATGDAAIQEQARADSAREREQLSPRIPALVIKLQEIGSVKARVKLDGVEIPSALLGVKRPVNPGKHVLTAAGTSQTLSLKEGEVREVTLRVSKDALPVTESPSAPPPIAPGAAPMQEAATPASNTADVTPGKSQRLAGWALIGVGGAGLITGGVTTGLALSKKASLSDQCPDNACLPAAHDDADSYNRLRMISTVGFVVGGVSAGAGVALLLTAPKARSVSFQVRGGVGAASLQAQGTF